MKIHRHDVIKNLPSEKQISNLLTTIEPSDMARTEPKDTNASYFTADSSGTVTLPTNLPPININQPEITANIASDGTITINEPTGQIDLSTLQLAGNESDNGLFTLPNIIVKKEPRCELCSAILDNNSEHLCSIQPNNVQNSQILVKKENNPAISPVPPPIFYCSFKKCGLSFDSQTNLEEHMLTFHQPPFSPAKTASHQNKTPNILGKKFVKFKSPLPPPGEVTPTVSRKMPTTSHKSLKIESRSISEKLLLDSLNERFHVSKMRDPNAPDDEMHPNKCHICPKTFKKPSDLVRHIRIHTGEKPYKCEECGKMFSVVSTLNTHKKIHARPSKHNAPDAIKCHICHGSFLSKNALKCHMRIHTGSTPFECPYCKEKFRTSGKRKTHIAAIHPGIHEAEDYLEVNSGIVSGMNNSNIRSSLDQQNKEGEGIRQEYLIPADTFNAVLETAAPNEESLLGECLFLVS